MTLRATKYDFNPLASGSNRPIASSLGDIQSAD